MNLKDIALKANVSISTVSRVLNGNQLKAASKEVQDRIWQIAREGGYLPNKEAQTLKLSRKSFAQNKVQSIYCLVACSPDEVRDDPFFSQIISSIQRAALHLNYVLEYTFSSLNRGNDPTLSLLQNASSDQLIIIGRFSREFFKTVRQKFKKIIYLGWNDLNVKCDRVICDGFSAARDGVIYLNQLGHEKIGFIGTDKNEARFLGFVNGIEALGLQFHDKNIINNPVLSYEFGYQGMEQLIRNGKAVTAIFCANDTTAIGALQACKSLNIKVPEQLSIMGMNDIESVQYISPMLTTIRIPLGEMGKIATRILVDRIQGGHTIPLKIILPYSIITRESCAMPPSIPIETK